MPFFMENKIFCVPSKTKDKTKKRKPNKTNKEGLGPSEVALGEVEPHLTLKPCKRIKTQNTKKTEQEKTNKTKQKQKNK